MANDEFPSDLADRFQVRMPPGMRDRIADAARANNRSMNAEIVSLLEMYYPPPPSAAELIQRISTAKQAMEGINDAKFLAEAERILTELYEMLANTKRSEDHALKASGQ